MPVSNSVYDGMHIYFNQIPNCKFSLFHVKWQKILYYSVWISGLQFAICKAFRQFAYELCQWNQILHEFLESFIDLTKCEVILSLKNTPCWITTWFHRDS